MSSALNPRQEEGFLAKEQDWREAVGGKFVRGWGNSALNRRKGILAGSRSGHEGLITYDRYRLIRC